MIEAGDEGRFCMLRPMDSASFVLLLVLVDFKLLKAEIELEKGGRNFPTVSYLEHSNHKSLFLSSHHPA